MPRITISYRRDDSGVITGRIFDRLAAHYGREAVFRDIDNIPPGVDFRQHIAKVLDESDILLAIVGPRWLGSRGGQNRLDDEADPVRLEIETGLRREMPVIPVLVLRAGMPRVGQLPDTVKDFAYRHAVQVDAGQDFDIHSARLIRAMDRILRQKGLTPPSDGDELTVPSELALPPSEDDEPLDDAPYAAAVVEPPPRQQPVVAPRAPAMSAALVEPIEPAAILPPVAREVIAPPAEKRRGGMVVGAVAGLALGAALGAGALILLRPAAPADVMALATAKEAAESKALTLQAEFAAAQKKLDTAQGNLDAAQKQASDANKRLQDLQTTTDQAQKALAAQQDIATKAKQQADQLTAQVQSLGDQQARADQDEKTLAAQKSAAADAATKLAQAQDQVKTASSQLAQAQDQVKTLGDQLAAEKKAHQDAVDQIAKLGGQIKTLQAQNAAAPTPGAQPGQAAATAAAPPPAITDDSSWSADQRKQAQADLVTVGYLQGASDGNFGATTRAAIKQLQSLTGETETGVMTDPEASALHDVAQRLSALLARGQTSPDGVSVAAVKGGSALYQRAWSAERGSNGASDPAEAVYWYGLAAAEGDGKALTNLGTLLIRGQGVAKPDPDGATVLWTTAAVRGEVTAMFNLGAMYEHGVGVTADLDKAKAWYQRGAARGDTGARAALKRLGA
ncbi:MAG TPA: peptidoglycan-binding protein [Stellaceae bacterium]|jgi:TPR repeat protein|nr:peptidoglycan-binding protein [Stellaceae bacterium]